MALQLSRLRDRGSRPLSMGATPSVSLQCSVRRTSTSSQLLASARKAPGVRLQAAAAAAPPARRFQLSRFFVPDITPEDGMTNEALARLRAEALTMPLWELGVRTALEVGFILVAWQVARAVVKSLSARGQQAIGHQIERGNVNLSIVKVVTDAAVVAVQQPARVFIPILTASNLQRTATLVLQIAAESDVLGNLHWLAKGAVGQLVKALSTLDAALIDASEIGVIVFMCWFFLAWKEELSQVCYLMERKLMERGQSDGGLERAVRPFSSLLGWAIVVAGVLSVLHVMHFNIQPLLAVGGVGGVAFGFGAQVVTANAVAGITLFVTRPFVVGDRVTLKSSGGSTVLTGIVERISPMRTVIRTEDGTPEAMPNKTLIDLIVSNDSQVQKGQQTGLGTKDPRRYSRSFTLKLEDLDKLDSVREEMRQFLQQHPSIDRSLPATVELTGLSGHDTFDLSIEAHTTATQMQDYKAFHSSILGQAARIFKRHSVAA